MTRLRSLSGMLFLMILIAFGTGLVWAPTVAAATSDPLPDIEVQDQSGRTLHFYRDLVKGNVVAVNFIFTGCSAVCPLLGASSAALSRELEKNRDPHQRVISISIDPGTDTPKHLREWKSHFGAAPDWTLVTGKERDINTLLRALQVYSADKNLHSGNFLLGNPDTNTWRRIESSTAPSVLAQTMRELASAKAANISATPPSAAASYFPDLQLLDQNGNARRFYSDLVKGRVVVISTFFSECSATCPMTFAQLARIQAQLGDRLGQDVFFLSITVDPLTDTPKKLKDYARQLGAKPGWLFLSGDHANVNRVLEKLGQFVKSRDAHSNLLLIGNEKTGLWKKANGLASANELLPIVASVMNDGH
ncbi:SCO family protein [Undibacterium sp. Ji50W]|uniref:SCO family protein n=1 Tax=Undibacterium sp. Ji50W TaxID=3413041 RepID=UPI003BF398D7